MDKVTKKKVAKKKVIRQPIGELKTTDMPLVAYLRYNAQIVQSVNKLTNFKAEFVFENVDRQLLDDFHSDTALVEPKLFAALMRQLTQSARSVTAE